MLHDVLFLFVSFCVSVLYLCIKEQFAKTVSTSVGAFGELILLRKYVD